MKKINWTVLAFAMLFAAAVNAQQNRTQLASAMIEREFRPLVPICFRYLQSGEAANKSDLEAIGFQKRGQKFLRRTGFKRALRQANSHIPNMVIFETVREHCRLNLGAFFHPHEAQEWAAKVMTSKGFRKIGQSKFGTLFQNGQSTIETKVLYGNIGTLLLIIPVK